MKPGRAFIFDLLSKPTLHPLDVTPRLRRRPLTGALGLWLLLLGESFGTPKRRRSSPRADPPEGGMPRSGRGDTDKRVEGGYRSK